MSEQLVSDLDGIYDVLVEECGAPEGSAYRDAFAAVWPGCVEYRFGGSLGFGGKVWWSHGRLYVSYYPEDRSEERDAATRRANERLARVMGYPTHGGWSVPTPVQPHAELPVGGWFGRMVDEVTAQGDDLVILKDGKPAAVVVEYGAYSAMVHELRDRAHSPTDDSPSDDRLRPD